MTTSGDVSVVVCTHAFQRLHELLGALASVHRQTVAPAEVLVVVDHNPALLAHVTATLPEVVAIASEGMPGLCAARNTGVAASRGELVAFLDDDALAEADWLERLVEPYADDRVVGVGGAIEPIWETARPAWFPPEFDWVIGCSYRGLPEERAAVRNPIGANMSFRRAAIEAVGGFTDAFARTATGSRLPVGTCDDTDIAIRILRAVPGGRVVYEPRARVRHRVPAGRSCWSYFWRRCITEGVSKAALSGLVGGEESLASEWTYARRVLPDAVGRGVRDAFAGDVAGAGRAAAIVAGLSITAGSYAAARARTRLAEARP